MIKENTSAFSLDIPKIMVSFTFHFYNQHMKHPFEQFNYCPQCGASHFEINDEKSKRCPLCGFVYYFNPAAATVAFILNERNDLLVCQRAKNPAKGTLDLPGGFSDLYENAEEGVAREVLEETGLTVTDCEYCFSIPNRYLYSGFTVHTLDLFFRCRVKDLQPLQAMDDAAEVYFVPPSEINPEDFGLESVRVGVKRFLKI